MAPKSKAEKAYDLAFNYEKNEKNCSQSTIRAILEVYNDKDLADHYQHLAGFSAGGGCLGDGCCGAYAAGIFFFGMKTGRRIGDIGADPEDPRGSSKNMDNFMLVKKLHDKFIQKFGSVTCHGIHRKLYGRPYNIIDEDEKEKFEKAGAHDWGCTSVCGLGAKWTVEIYEDYIKKKNGDK